MYARTPCPARALSIFRMTTTWPACFDCHLRGSAKARRVDGPTDHVHADRGKTVGRGQNYIQLAWRLRRVKLGRRGQLWCGEAPAIDTWSVDCLDNLDVTSQDNR